MKLSGVVLSLQGEKRLPIYLATLSQLVDELIVCIDDASTDRSFEIAKTFTPHVFYAKHCGHIEPHMRGMIERCTGDWVLHLDDDEGLGPEWTRSGIEKYLCDKNFTHYQVARKWVLPDNESYIASRPWYPDYQMRLFRNIPSLLTFSEVVHGRISVQGACGHIEDLAIQHYDFVLNDRKQREIKVARYESHRPGQSGADYYLYEDSTYETLPLAELATREQTAKALARATESRETQLERELFEAKLVANTLREEIAHLRALLRQLGPRIGLRLNTLARKAITAFSGR